MPSWNDFIAGFGAREWLLAVITLAIIVLAREERRIFRRKK